MDNMRQISAIAGAGKKEGLSYGQMAAKMREMSEREQERIREEHEKIIQERKVAELEAKKAKRRKGGKKGRPLTYDPKRAMELYKARLTDKEIAKELHTTARAIQDWRIVNGLKRNKNTENPPSS